MPLTSTLRWGNLKMCTDISRMCCFVSSLRISQIFKQEARVAEILHYRNRRDAGKYRLSPHPVQGRNQSKFFPSKFGTFLPWESERLPREGNAGPEKHPRHQTDFSHPPQLKLTCERNLLKKPLWKSLHWPWRLLADQTTQALLRNPRGETQPGNDSPLG